MCYKQKQPPATCSAERTAAETEVVMLRMDPRDHRVDECRRPTRLGLDLAPCPGSSLGLPSLSRTVRFSSRPPRGDLGFTIRLDERAVNTARGVSLAEHRTGRKGFARAQPNRGTRAIPRREPWFERHGPPAHSQCAHITVLQNGFNVNTSQGVLRVDELNGIIPNGFAGRRVLLCRGEAGPENDGSHLMER